MGGNVAALTVKNTKCDEFPSSFPDEQNRWLAVLGRMSLLFTEVEILLHLLPDSQEQKLKVPIFTI